MELERRVYAADKVQIERRDDAKPRIVGHSAVFNQEVRIGGAWGWIEKIAPGAFARAVKGEDDVRALFNHNENWVLGRNKSGTLKLAEDQVGLFMDVEPPDTQLVRDLVLTPIERGDVSGQSIGFRVMKQQWEERGEDVVRTLLEVELFDVSPVTFPAYPTTDVALRSALGAAPDAIRAELERRASSSSRGGLTTATAGLVMREAVQRIRATQIR